MKKRSRFPAENRDPSIRRELHTSLGSCFRSRSAQCLFFVIDKSLDEAESIILSHVEASQRKAFKRVFANVYSSLTSTKLGDYEYCDKLPSLENYMEHDWRTRADRSPEGSTTDSAVGESTSLDAKKDEGSTGGNGIRDASEGAVILPDWFRDAVQSEVSTVCSVSRER